MSFERLGTRSEVGDGELSETICEIGGVEGRSSEDGVFVETFFGREGSERILVFFLLFFVGDG